MTDTTTAVLDAGGRYGVHPSWKSFRGELRYFLFEPERDEAARLTAKYAGRTPADVAVLPVALGASEGTVRIHRLRHPGLSSAYEPNPDALSFAYGRKEEGEIVGAYEAPMTTVDAFADRNALGFDFLKLDTEGSEATILDGAARQLEEHVLGVRCEVFWDRLFKGAPLFGDIHDRLAARGFELLNLDYDGRGTHCSRFAVGPRYGKLEGCDAVWIRPLDRV